MSSHEDTQTLFFVPPVTSAQPEHTGTNRNNSDSNGALGIRASVNETLNIQLNTSRLQHNLLHVLCDWVVFQEGATLCCVVALGVREELLLKRLLVDGQILAPGLRCLGLDPQFNWMERRGKRQKN